MTNRHSQTEAGCQTKEDRNEERETDGQAVQREDKQRWTERSGLTEETKRLVHCAQTSRVFNSYRPLLYLEVDNHGNT